MEVELKLLLAPADNDQLLRHPLIAAHAGAPVRTRQLTARYFDTPDLHLLHHGAGLRVRKVDGEWIQTMKAGGSVQSGLHSRNEWEGPVDRPWPRLGRLRKLIGDAPRWLDLLAAPELKQRLEPLFVVDVQRHSWDLEVDGNKIELVLDHGHIERHGHRAPLNEIELELKDGNPASLFAFALQLHEQIPLRLSNINKAERGYMLVRQTGTVPYRAKALELPADATLAETLPAVLGNCLQQIQRNENAVIDGDDAETLHQMRVGVRRLRSALKLFESVAPCPPALLEDVGWLGAELGAARDWDVLLTSTLARVQVSPGGKTGLMDLQALALAAAQAKRREAAQALLSPRYTHLMLALGSWMLQAAPGLQGSAAKFSRQTMQDLHKSLLKRAGRMDDSDPAGVHRTRIAAKRARYALEFFHSLYRSNGARAYLKTLAATQEQLGRHNDLVVADKLLRELAQQHPQAEGAIHFARGYLLAQQATQSTDLAAIRNELHAQRLPHKARPA
ncbi:CYTH and CHAD domain-containing protein [Duganella aceris]|uniref:CYTH and CHAD domain-containing protein n=1 Tax=Duganella aceris TaxID=2703883 RepID=A0ABX0FUL7_9BURK|nr:CYTH and CHAD domain-containing protein [Duganella aceris]NGZ88082.1 CYTH and CHAD domain-containing protein [Duganella aceris]